MVAGDHEGTRQLVEQVVCHLAQGPCHSVPPCTPETRAGPCTSVGSSGGPLCIYATRDSIDPGGHGFAWDWVCRLGHAHADMA